MSDPTLAGMNSLTAAQLHRLAVLPLSAREQVLRLVAMHMSFSYALALVRA